MIHRENQGAFAYGPLGRIPLALPSQGGSHVHLSGRVAAGVSTITSRRPGALTTEEYLALRHGLTLTQVRQFLRAPDAK